MGLGPSGALPEGGIPPYRDSAFSLAQDLPFGFKPDLYVGGMIGNVLSSTDAEYLASLLNQTRFRLKQQVSALVSSGTSSMALRAFATLMGGLGNLFLRTVDADGKPTTAWAALERKRQSELLHEYTHMGPAPVDPPPYLLAGGRYAWCAPFNGYLYGRNTVAFYASQVNTMNAALMSWDAYLKSQADRATQPPSPALPPTSPGMGERAAQLAIPLTDNLVIVPFPELPVLEDIGAYDVAPDVLSPFLTCAALVHRERALDRQAGGAGLAVVKRFHITARPYSHLNWWPFTLGEFHCDGRVLHVNSAGAEDVVTAAHQEDRLVVQGDKRVTIPSAIIDLLPRVLTVNVPGEREVDLREYQDAEVWSL